MQIEGMVAVVTGGGSGLGEAVARALAARGARVGVLDLRIDAAQRVAAAIGGLALACDVADDAGATRALEEATATLGPPRLLMNVAGIGGARRMIDKSRQPAPLADFRWTLDVNLVGTSLRMAPR
jgi:NAD(P)-dependent dehydrogenase (short-subunit alcohol dehydrogenase family)